MGTILLILLILLLIGALPAWPYSSGWGYWPSGGLGLNPANCYNPRPHRASLSGSALKQKFDRRSSATVIIVTPLKGVKSRRKSTSAELRRNALLDCLLLVDASHLIPSGCDVGRAG